MHSSAIYGSLVAARHLRGIIQTARSSFASAVGRTFLFWLMLLMMAIMATSGFMATSRLAQITRDFRISIVWVQGAAARLPIITLDRVAKQPDAASLRLGFGPSGP